MGLPLEQTLPLLLEHEHSLRWNFSHSAERFKFYFRVHSYLTGYTISNNLTEATLIIRFFSPLFEKIMTSLSDKLIWKWGESTLITSASRRNSQTEDDRVQLGQRTDAIGSLYMNQLEIMLIEFSPPSEQLYGSKARSDRSKIIQDMKDALDRVLLTVLRGSNRQELEQVFVIGVQVVGQKVMVDIMNLAYNKVYRFQEIDVFNLPLNERDMRCQFGPMLLGFLRLKSYVDHIICFIEKLCERYAGQSELISDSAVEQMIYRSTHSTLSPTIPRARRNSDKKGRQLTPSASASSSPGRKKLREQEQEQEQ
ncbi:hypothetical protein BC936DRAFT_136532 [Jimgerdemannia flammicorona]|uniref:Uncharacterized protein n=1 Tax=Jimgerdemannia flammicorona TaxID=994334 RepID=A0A433DP21_9FUNG|nr:hypothetical protein BC936DRAFT_136532 [Jimgerdemannia flammicorona]